MPIFISSPSAARRHAAYAIERSSGAIVRAIGTGVAAIVGQFPWGPDGVVTTPSGPKDLIHQIAPPGMDHSGSGYLSVAGKGWPTLKFVRVLGAGAAPATVSLPNAAGAGVALVTARYKGYFGNSLLATVSNATDGDPNHWKLTVQLAGPSGSSVEIYDGLNFSGTGPDSAPSFARAYLVGAIARVAGGRPANGTYAFANGSDGVVNALSYTGTAGAGIGGIAALEGDGTIRHVFADDPGGALRPAVNAALRQHVEAMGDRIAFVNGSPGQTVAQVATDVGNVRSARVAYMDPWVYVLDEAGVKRLAPPAACGASVAAQVSPTTSIAWKDPEVRAMLNGIVDLEYDRGNGAADNTDQGVCTIIQEDGGGFSIEAGVTTLAPSDPTRRNLTRTRLGDYVAVSLVRSSRSFVDAPNVPQNQQAVVTMMSTFMNSLVAAKDTDPNHKPFVLAYSVPELSEFNSQADLDNGALTIPLDYQQGPEIERLLFSMRFGEGVQIRANA